MDTQINRRNFRQEYNLLRLECEEVRKQNIILKREMLKLMEMMTKRRMQ
jgi:hypothetical protein